MGNPLRLTSLNHISIVCRSLEKSLQFYQDVLGFFPIRRPDSFDFDGAWLFNYGLGIHLLQSEDPSSMPRVGKINPKDNHVSFQCESMANVEKCLNEMKIEYVKARVEEGGIGVDQLFFHDPDGMMIEICNCDNLPVVPLSSTSSCPRITCNLKREMDTITSHRPHHHQKTTSSSAVSPLPSLPPPSMENIRLLNLA